jgi:hypothetical protein
VLGCKALPASSLQYAAACASSLAAVCSSIAAAPGGVWGPEDVQQWRELQARAASLCGRLDAWGDCVAHQAGGTGG